MARVDFYFSIGSRYSYLAASQIDRIASETGCQVEWHPLDSTRLLAARKVNPFVGEPISGQYEWSYRERDAARWAAFYEIAFVEPRGRVVFDPELLALACTAAKSLGSVEGFSRSLFDAMFGGAVSRIDDAECIRRAETCGMAASAFDGSLRSQNTSRQLEFTRDAALAAGVFGVPTFIVGNELFWGNDRLTLLVHHLRKLGDGSELT